MSASRDRPDQESPVLLAEISIWAPLIYQYSVGGTLFLACLGLTLRAKACDISRRADRFWLFVALAGMTAYFGVHLAVYLLAIYAVPPGVRCRRRVSHSPGSIMRSSHAT